MRTNGPAPHGDGLAKWPPHFLKTPLLRHMGVGPLQPGQLLFMGVAPPLAGEAGASSAAADSA